MGKINVMDLFMLDVKSNRMIKVYRKSLGLETPNNRIDTGDLKMIIMALSEMGFSVVKYDGTDLPDEKEDIKDICNCPGNITGRHDEFCKIKNRILP